MGYGSVTSRSKNPVETYDRAGLVIQQKECGEETQKFEDDFTVTFDVFIHHICITSTQHEKTLIIFCLMQLFKLGHKNR